MFLINLYILRIYKVEMRIYYKEYFLRKEAEIQ